MSRSDWIERSENGGRVTQTVVVAQDGAVAIVEVVFTNNSDARDVIDLAYEKAKRAVSRDQGEVEGGSTEVAGSGGAEDQWVGGLPHA